MTGRQRIRVILLIAVGSALAIACSVWDARRTLRFRALQITPTDGVLASREITPMPASGSLRSPVSQAIHLADRDTTKDVELCQFLFPQPRMLYGVDAQSWRTPRHEPGWMAARPLAWEEYGHGEYVGPARTAHLLEYRLRVDDQLDLVYRFTHEEIHDAYRLLVGDELIIESFPEDDPQAIRRGDINQGRGLIVQPDGTIVLPAIGRVAVVGRTIDEVKHELEGRYGKFIREPNFTVTPLKTNTRLEDLRSAVDARFGSGGQTRTATVAPDGTIQLVGLASVPAQGLTLDELQAELNERYIALVGRGVEVTVTLRARARRFVWVVGEVNQPGQFELNQPITVVQALVGSPGTELEFAL